ncbi:unnamed protein product [Closterium sp. Naga37s-1]|nr:unnamed protein product [Closterium sp. Naga37s-1]
MLDATVKTNEAASAAAAQLSNRTGLLPANEKPEFLAAVKSIIAKRWDGQLHNSLHALGWLLSPKNQYIGEVRNDPEPVTSSEVERCWSALARVQRRDRNRLNAKSMTDVAFVAFGRRARDAFDKKGEARGKLYADLGNGTLREGSSSVALPPPVEAEVDDEEEGGEPCAIDWDSFGSIGKRAPKRKGAALKKKSGTNKASASRKGKEKVRDEEEEEEEAADSDSSGGGDEPAKRKNKGPNPWDCSDGDSGEEDDEEEDEEDEEDAYV